MEAIAIGLEAIASGLEAILIRLEAINMFFTHVSEASLGVATSPVSDDPSEGIKGKTRIFRNPRNSGRRQVHLQCSHTSRVEVSKHSPPGAACSHARHAGCTHPVVVEKGQRSNVGAPLPGHTPESSTRARGGSPGLTRILEADSGSRMGPFCRIWGLIESIQSRGHRY